ncbi:major capsid protein [Klebsiella phage RCIP0075]
MSNIEQALRDTTAKLESLSGDLRAQAERSAKAGEIAAADRAKVDELLSNQGELKAELKNLQQKVAEKEGNGAGGDVQHLSLGAQFIQADGFKALSAMPVPRGRVDHSYKAALGALDINTAGNGQSAGDLYRSTRLPGIQMPGEQRLTIRDLLMPGRMDGQVLEYVKEKGFINNAAPVAEGDRKPQSSVSYELVTTSAKVLAHTMKASRQILSDASQMQSLIDFRLRNGLKVKEEDQLLNGDGTGQNLHGLIPQAAAFNRTNPNETAIDRIRYALLQTELAHFAATGIVLHPEDWCDIELAKDTLGRYIIGNPQGTLAPRLWNRPVVTTQAIDLGKLLVGAFDTQAQIFDRWEMRVEVATENEDDFVKNMVTLLCEERLAFAVYRPEAFAYGDLKAAGGEVGG